jgi:hypothetical protein
LLEWLREFGAVEADQLHMFRNARLRQRLRDRLIEKQFPRAAVLEHTEQTFWRRGRRERGDSDAGAQRTEKYRAVLDSRQCADRDDIAGAKSVALQRGGDTVHRGIELRVG